MKDMWVAQSQLGQGRGAGLTSAPLVITYMRIIKKIFILTQYLIQQGEILTKMLLREGQEDTSSSEQRKCLVNCKALYELCNGFRDRHCQWSTPETYSSPFSRPTKAQFCLGNQHAQPLGTVHDLAKVIRQCLFFLCQIFHFPAFLVANGDHATQSGQ